MFPPSERRRETEGEKAEFQRVASRRLEEETAERGQKGRKTTSWSQPRLSWSHSLSPGGGSFFTWNDFEPVSHALSAPGAEGNRGRGMSEHRVSKLPVKGQTQSRSGFTGHRVSVTTTRLCQVPREQPRKMRTRAGVAVLP